MSGLTLIASYPKSGSTWLRAFLSSVALGGRTPNINGELGAIRSLSARALCERLGDVDCDDLSPRAIAALRPLVSRRAAQAAAGIYKVHDANLVPPEGEEPAIPADVIDRVVYVVRDPRDVAVSFAAHFGMSIEQAAATLGDPTFMLGHADDRPNAQVDQFLSSWAAHVASWIDSPGLHVHLVRYEDLVAQPLRTFAALCAFLDLAAEGTLIEAAIEAVRIDALAGQEDAAGFVERHPLAAARFFRRGVAGGWRQTLTPPLVARIEREQGAMMVRLGYL